MTDPYSGRVTVIFLFFLLKLITNDLFKCLCIRSIFCECKKKRHERFTNTHISNAKNFKC